MSRIRALAVAGMVGVVAMTGCATTNPYSSEQKGGEQTTSKTAVGVGVGALAGAALGALTSSKHDRSRGLLTGAAVGGAIGGAVGYRADKQEAQLRERLANSGVAVERQGDTINLVVPGAISFATNSAQLTPDFYASLNQVAGSLKEYPDSSVQIVGHTDSTGPADFNQQLSVNRANAVVVYLSAQSIDPARMQALGMGPSQPVADNQTREGRAQNRRVEIKIIPRETAAEPYADERGQEQRESSHRTHASRSYRDSEEWGQ
jgi:outer membrane protein OmpA-like peptidoglycan-associated protein